jgi:hypothetical protein
MQVWEQLETQPDPPGRGIKAREISRNRAEARPAGRDDSGLRNRVLTSGLQLV